MSHPDTEQTYQALRCAMMRAQEAGVRIICEAFELKDYDAGEEAKLLGCCAYTAGCLYDCDSIIGLTEPMLFALVSGFDAVEPLFRAITADEKAWYDVGLRLRDEFNPITATDLERELGLSP